MREGGRGTCVLGGGESVFRTEIEVFDALHAHQKIHGQLHMATTKQKKKKGDSVKSEHSF